MCWASHSSELGFEQEWTKILYIGNPATPLPFPNKYTSPWHQQPLHLLAGDSYVIFTSSLTAYVIGMKLLAIGIHIYNLLMLQNKLCLLNKLWPFLSEHFWKSYLPIIKERLRRSRLIMLCNSRLLLSEYNTYIYMYIYNRQTNWWGLQSE